MLTESTYVHAHRTTFRRRCLVLTGGGGKYARTAWTTWAGTAATAEEGERRVVSYIGFDYEDNLRGLVATAVETDGQLTLRLPSR